MLDRKNILAKEIAEIMNEINNFTFTEKELEESTNEYAYMLVNEKYTILNTLQIELDNGNKKVIGLIKKILAF